MAAIPHPAYLGDYWDNNHYPYATTATTATVYYINNDSCATTWPMLAQVAEFIPGRRQPVWEDSPRAPKRVLLMQYSAPTQRVFMPRTAPSRCQMHRQKRKMRVQSLI